MKCIDCDGTISPVDGRPLGAMRVGYRGSVVICGACASRYGPGVALDLRLDEAMASAYPDPPGTKRSTRKG